MIQKRLREAKHDLRRDLRKRFGKGIIKGNMMYGDDGDQVLVYDGKVVWHKFLSTERKTENGFRC